MGEDVRLQYSRDFTGHFAALFNHNIPLGRKYLFDVSRTAKEAYDHARRVLYHANRGIQTTSSPASPEVGGDAECEGCKQSRALEEVVLRLREALLCVVCCQEEIDAAFCPCGHLVCCQSCAAQLEVRTLAQGLSGVYVKFKLRGRLDRPSVHWQFKAAVTW